ncbi:ABC transporter ATP-binding protein [Halovivax limisalsi]|uniref:ABC transporter ATP-binding protein n=1 Tax=Halovivax limisalsi TaxID=1453760 RepID=UPI001FFCFAB7|nr:ABC transporter ATP-binding protein [Halovivax limisalsi]
MSEDPLLSVSGLQTQFFTESGTVRAVDGISFDVYEGEIVGIVGESGAGKSVASMSLLRLIESPGEIVAGEITYRGKTIFAAEEGSDGQVRRHEDMLSNEAVRREIRGNEIAVIFQDPMESLNPVFTIGGQLREFIEVNRDLSKTEAKAEAIQMLREVGIPDPANRYDEYPHQFSGGMRQRVLIAMALACRPDLIIADEPTTALDVTVEGQILDLVDDLQKKYGTSFIWVTHDMGVVAEICDRVNVMYLGEIVESAPVDELFYETSHPYTRALLESMPRPDRTVEDLNPISGVMPEAINPPPGCRFHPRCPDAKEICKRIHPDPRPVASAETDEQMTVQGERPTEHGEYPTEQVEHRSACLKGEAFDVGYETSDPLATDAKAEATTGASRAAEIDAGGDLDE